MESRAVLDRVHYRVSFRKLAALIVTLPLTSLVVCFVTAMVFQYKEVNTTICDVYNFIPSISAITGISPQRYIWRIGVAFHCTPRLLIASVYYTYYASLADNVDAENRKRYLKWVNINYWLNVSENLSLVGVTYISNRENYSIHEKLFIIFMFSSLTYMLLNCILFKWGNPTMTVLTRKSYLTKVSLLSIKIISSIGLLYFFYRHRKFCDELAFSCFSFCEYCMAIANMSYHVTIIWDCPDQYIVVGAPVISRKSSVESSSPSAVNNADDVTSTSSSSVVTTSKHDQLPSSSPSSPSSSSHVKRE